MSLDRLWSGWRSAYVASAAASSSRRERPADGSTIFEQILASELGDDETYVVWRGASCAALLNIYPYTNGHVMVLPLRAAQDLGDLSEAVAAELWWGVRAAVRAVRSAYSPDGVNVGMNLGEAAGAGIPDHLHVHVLPRWAGDTNFMTSVAQTRVMPEALGESWSKLRAAWPSGGVGSAFRGDGTVAGDA